MLDRLSPHLRAVLQALFVTFLWSTSWVFIKVGLRDIPALTFAGLRYTLAYLCLMPFFLRAGHLASIRALSRRDWTRLFGLGVLYYTLTAGTQFLGLAYLPAVTVNLLLSFTSILVALLGIGLLGERPTGRQWLGIGLSLLGALVYFGQGQDLPQQGASVGFLVVGVGVLANALSSVLGRSINRGGALSPLAVTVVSMGVGAALLLLAGVAMQGLPPLSALNWLTIGWLAVVNTAVAFTLWNHTLRTLSAMESSIINNTMMIQIPILAILFLGERLTWQQGVGMVVAGAGALLVQLGRRRA